MSTKRLLKLVVVVGGMIAARRLLPSLLEKLPSDFPPKLVISILPRLQKQNDEIIGLLREQNDLLRRGRLEPETRESPS